MFINRLFILLFSLSFCGLALAEEDAVSNNPSCSQPIDPNNECFSLLGNTYIGTLANPSNQNELDVTLHFDTVTCGFSDKMHPRRNMFFVTGQLNNLEFSLEHGRYRSCITNYYNNEIKDMRISTNNHSLNVYYDPQDNQCTPDIGDDLCVIVADHDTNESFRGILKRVDTE